MIKFRIGIGVAIKEKKIGRKEIKNQIHIRITLKKKIIKAKEYFTKD